MSAITSCISRINNTQIDDAQYIDVVIPMCNLIEYIDNYSKTSGTLWQYWRDVLAVDNNGAATDFTGADTTDSFSLKENLTGQTGNNCTKIVAIMVPLKYLSHFWRTLEMPLIGAPALTGRFLWIGVCPSFCPSVWKFSCDWLFLKLSMVLGAMGCCAWQNQIFWKKNFCLKKWGKWAKNWHKISFLKFIRKFSHYFFLNLVCNERLYYFLYSCTNFMFGKNLVPEKWAKMLSGNQMTGFLNQLYF